MAETYDQELAKPNFSNDEELMEKRYSAIVENQTVQRRGSEHQYMGRRNKALKAMRNNKNAEQDATILAAMHEEHMSADNWSQGAKHRVRNTSYVPAKQVAMTIQNHDNRKKKKPPPPPSHDGAHNRSHTEPPNNPNKLSTSHMEHKGSASSGASIVGSDFASSSGGQMNGASEENVLKHHNNNNSHEYTPSIAGSNVTMSKVDSNTQIGRNETLETAPSLDEDNSRSQMTRTATNSKYNDEDIYNEMEFEKFKPSFCIHLFVFILVTVLCGGVFYYYYRNEWPQKGMYREFMYIIYGKLYVFMCCTWNGLYMMRFCAIYFMKALSILILIHSFLQNVICGNIMVYLCIIPISESM